MPRASLTSAEIEDFRDRACGVATELFAERGLAAVSMRQIAGALGVSAMTPYRYFRNKDELLAQVRTLAFRRFANQQRDSFEQAEPRTRLAALASAYIAFAESEPQAYKVMFELEQSSSAEFPELEHEQRRAFQFLLEATTEAVESGRLDGDPTTTAHLLWAQIHGLVSLHLAGKLIMGRSFGDLCMSPTIAAL